MLKQLNQLIQYGGNATSNKMFYIIIIVIAVSFFVYDYYKTQYMLSQTQTAINTQAPQTSQQPTPSILVQTSPPPPAPPVGRRLREYDYRALNDELTPPFKRDDYMVPPQLVYPNDFGLYTRGMPGTFRKMGYLKNLTSTDYKFLTLMGRQKYRSSTQYEYYVTSTSKDENIKFYLDNYKRELYSGDKVKVSQLGNEEYEVIIDKNLDYEYIPYV